MSCFFLVVCRDGLQSKHAALGDSWYDGRDGQNKIRVSLRECVYVSAHMFCRQSLKHLLPQSQSIRAEGKDAFMLTRRCCRFCAGAR